MRVWGVTIAIAAPLLLCAWWCARVGVRNVAQARRLAAEPPLDAGAIVAAARAHRPPPKGWPDTTAVDDARVASAYRDLARSKAENAVMLGDLVMLVSGAWLGTTVQGLFGGWDEVPHALAPLVLAMAGMLLGKYGEWRWAPVAAGYEWRRRVLRAHAASDAATAPPPRKRWWRRR